MRKRDSLDLAAVYLKKAGDDAVAVREFALNQEIADSIIGFHAQQAVEKWLKAVVAARGLEIERTHDIDRLIEVAIETDHELPVDRDELVALTDYAVPLRYEEILDAEELNRELVVRILELFGDWATKVVESGKKDAR